MALIGDMQYLTIGDKTYSLPVSGADGTVTSVRVQATSPVQSSVNTAQTSSLNTTISLANEYGDTKNPYGTKSVNYVLAGPSSGSSAAVPSFRKLVAADIPDLSGTYLTSFTETDPTVPAWAKASSKPSYTASEVGASPTGHTHATSISTSTGTNQLTLARNTKYAITAGGTSYIFTTPASDNTDTKVTTEALTSGTTYYPVLATGTGTAIRQIDSTLGGLKYTSTAGTSSAVGTSILYLGNATGSGTANNEQGVIRLYSSGATYYTDIKSSSASSNKTITFPNASGTVALTSDIPDVSGFITTDSDKKLEIAAVTSGTTYYPVVATNSTTAATRQYDSTGFIYTGTNGTANGSNGNSLLTLGNSTASTSANWKKGTVRLYGTTANYSDLVSGAPSANRTITLPDKTGTVALTSDIPTVPTKTSDLTNDSGFITSYTDENMKWTASTSTNTYYPLQSTSTATTSTANTLNSVSFYQYYNTAGGYRRLILGNGTSYTSTGGAYGTIRLYGTSATYYGDLNPGTIGANSLTANRTWTLPNATGTIALTDDIPDVSGKIDTAGTGLSKSGTTLNHSNSVTVQNTQAVYPIKIDAQGHISAYGSAVSIFSGNYNDLTNKPTIPTNTDEKLKTVALTSGTAYYPILANGANDAVNRQVDSTLGGLKYISTAGTTSAVGTAVLQLGNATASGTANNEQGVVRLYSQNATYYTDLVSSSASSNKTITLPNATGTVALTSDIPSVPTSTANSVTGISIGNHSTGSVTGVQSSTTTASKVTLGTAKSVPNVTSAGSASTWAFEDVTVPIRNDSATSIPNVTSVGSASTWSFSDVTVPIRADSDTTVPTAASSATTVPIKNTSATSIPNVTAVGSGSFTSGTFSGGSGSFTQGSFSGGSGSFSASVTDHVLSFSHTHTAATHGTDTHTHTAATHGADSHTHTAPTLGTAISIIGVQSSTTSVTGVSGSTSVRGVKTGTSSTTTASKASGSNGTAPTLGTAISIYGVKSGTSSTVTASHVKSGGNGTAPTLGTAISIPNVTGVTDVTVPIKNSSATTVVTSATHSITDNGHTHSI